MRAILIDPARNAIEDVTFEGTLHDAYKMLGITAADRGSETVEQHVLNLIDPMPVLLVDEEGWLPHRDTPLRLGRFRVRLYDGEHRTFAGRGLVVAVERGEWREPACHVDYVRRLVTNMWAPGQ